MKKLIILLTFFLLVFSGCSKEEKAKYNLVLCDTQLESMGEHLSDFETENYVVENIDFNNGQFENYVSVMEQDCQYIQSVTVYSENLPEETAKNLISFVKKENVPVIFAFTNISAEILTSYDKAFCVTTDYIHAGEIVAVKLKQLWSDGTIADTDGNQIFSFAVIKQETESQELEDFYSTLISGIELYGIPMQINSIVEPAEIADIQSLADLKSANEGIVVISPEILPIVQQYASETEKVEIITILQGAENIFNENPHILNCFVDFKDYKTAVDEILENYNNRQYPLIESSFFVKDRTVFIPATI